MKHTEKMKMKKLLLATSAAVLVTAAGTCAIYMAAESAEKTVEVTEIDYDNLTLTVTAQSEDNRVYFATSKTATTWEKIPGDLDGSKITMDISWVSATKNTTLYFKGDKTETPCEVTLPKQNTAFKATFNPAENSMAFVNMGDADDVYWKKSTTTTWTKYDGTDNDTKALLESFCTKGITLHFRTGQVQGTSSTSVGMRPSKTYAVKIAKRAAAPKITLDYSKLAFSGVKKTMEYKSASDGWNSIDSTTLALEDALPAAMQTSGNSGGDDPESVSIDFRIKATATKVASQVCTIKVPVQESTPDNVELVYTGSKQCKIVTTDKDKEGDENAIAAASAANPYEYTIVKEGSLDISKAKWITIKTPTVTISSTAAPKDSTIYVRKKATKTALATAVKSCTVTGYPSSDANTVDTVDLKKIQGVELEPTAISMTVLGTDTKVAAIMCGGTTVGFTQTSTPVDDEKSAITVTITDVSKVENIPTNLEKTLDIRFVLDNEDDITKGTLYIQKAATIEDAAYTKYVDIPFTSDMNDNIEFNVALNSTEKTNVSIKSITYNENTLMPSTDADTKDYTVGTVVDNKIPVTIHKDTIDQLAKYLKKSDYGTANSFVVTLTNGETLKQVTAKVAYPVTVSANASSVGISKSGYKAALDQAKENNTTLTGTYADPVITYTLKSDAAKGKSYAIKSLTWNGIDVLSSYTGSDSSWKVTLSLAKLTAYPSIGNAELTLILTNTDNPSEELKVNYGYYITLTD